MQKVLAFFGAFNPPTKAHVDLAKLAMDQAHASAVIFIPSKASYITDAQQKSFAFSDAQRLDMLYSVYENNRDWMLFTDHEIKSNTQPRTYDTLCWLRDRNGFSPILLVGSDQLFAMQSGWKHVPEIAKEFGIICLSRYESQMSELLDSNAFYRAIAPYVQVVEAPEAYHWMSSTEARSEMRDIQRKLRVLQRILPDEIYDHLKEYMHEI